MEVTKEKFILKGEGSWNLSPKKYPWAFEMAQKSIASHWTPQSIPMGKDRACFEQVLTPDERSLFTMVFASLTTADLAAAGNLVEQVFTAVKAAEIRMFVGRQIAEETIHSMSYEHILEVLSLDPEEVYTLYRRVPEINDWFEYAANQNSYTQKDAVLPLIFWYAIYEGVFFMGAFASILSLQRRNLMVGTGQQLIYIAKDETSHVGFGIKLLREIFRELGQMPSEAEVHNLFLHSMEKIDAWAERCIPTVLGYSATLHKQHCRYLADKRLITLGYSPLFGVTEEILPWLNEQMGSKKEVSFFEKHPTDYQVGAGLDFGESGSLDDLINWRS